MIEGYLPGLVRVDPVGVAPAEVVAQALRCELLEAVADAGERFVRAYDDLGAAFSGEVKRRALLRRSTALEDLRAALVAAGATGKAGT